MKVQKEIIISGVGGQGMILCGTMLGEAASVYGKKHVTLSSEYGVEARGTFAKSDLIVSDDEIFFPDVTDPDLVICMAQVAYERYSGKLPEKALLIYNQDLVNADASRSWQECGISITRMSRRIGNSAVANIIIMGIIAEKMQIVDPDSAKKVLTIFFGKCGKKSWR